jgi:hypothetical protein
MIIETASLFNKLHLKKNLFSHFLKRLKSFSFVANYDANVQAVVTGLQITLAEPRRKGDEVSVLSTEVHFERVESRRKEGLRGLKNGDSDFHQKIAFN